MPARAAANFTVAGTSYAWEDLVLAGCLWGDSPALEASVRDGLACLARLDDLDEDDEDALAEEDVETAATEFRYARDLVAASDLESVARPARTVGRRVARSHPPLAPAPALGGGPRRDPRGIRAGRRRGCRGPLCAMLGAARRPGQRSWSSVGCREPPSTPVVPPRNRQRPRPGRRRAAGRGRGGPGAGVARDGAGGAARAPGGAGHGRAGLAPLRGRRGHPSWRSAA